MKTLYFICTLIFCWPLEKDQHELSFTTHLYSSTFSAWPEVTDTTLVELRKAGAFRVLVLRVTSDDNIYTIITTRQPSGPTIDQLAFAETLSALDSSCHRYQEHGAYQFVNDVNFKITTKSYDLACGAEQPDNESDENYLRRLMDYEDPYAIPGRELNQEIVKRYDIDGQGKLVERKNSSSQKVLTDRWFSVTRFDKLPKEKVRLLRNTIYAMKGYKFKAEDLRSYFSLKEWYKPAHENIAKMLSPSDRELISYLEKLENR